MSDDLTTTDAAAGAAPAVRIRDLRLTIDGRQILRGLDLTLPKGKVTGLAGESGSGKTMTGMALIGLQPEGAVVEGAIDFGGLNLLALSRREFNRLRGARIAMVFQDPTSSLHPMLSIGRQLTDHLRHHLRMSRREALDRAAELLARVGVPDPRGALRKYPHEFSGGQLQRIAIAGAIACEPELLIADEPTTALDVTVQAGILRLLRELCDELGLTVVLITHDFGVLSSLADEIAVMRRGEIVEQGHRYEVIRNPRHPYTRELIESLPMHELAPAEGPAEGGEG
ncbi:ABC transporter ATP-binding protein [Gryllotalpicola ginsengisoli]|uniref:ABC transporter ATP-binding protein n=1 Tax=Gryllotalpicola ginsengisoli TaxID=444608 RepID=UPI0004007744|nr:ABC transporter ATP-binding protein [Gryllotalpicola ginsengisoli]